MTNAFALLTANRKANAAVFGIFRVTKSGRLAVTPTATESTIEYADATRDRIADLNPGKEYVVRSL